MVFRFTNVKRAQMRYANRDGCFVDVRVKDVDFVSSVNMLETNVG